MNHGSCSIKLNIKPTKDEITPPNVTTVADEEGTDRQTNFALQTWQTNLKRNFGNYTVSGQQLSLVFTSP